MIIGFCGYARSGKDTCANILSSLHKNHRIMKCSFADSLRGLAYDINSFIPESKMFYRDMIDTLGYEDSKTMPGVRDYLVRIGEGARMNISPDVWIMSLDYKIRNSDYDIYIICDVRYPNEVDYILSKGGTVIYLDRPGVGPANEVEANSIREILEMDRVIKIRNIDYDSTEQALKCIL